MTSNKAHYWTARLRLSSMPDAIGAPPVMPQR
jgi:hypothetical protein